MVWETLWEYILIFLMAAVPWLEILVVIPIGIAIGLNPILVAVVSFLGNFLPILLIIYLFKWLQETNWYKKRQEKKQKKQLEMAATLEEDNQDEVEVEKKKSKKERALAIFQKYGLPGLAMLGPLITGIHLACVLALSFKANKNKTTFWMGVSLFTWTIILTAASYYGIDWITDWF